MAGGPLYSFTMTGTGEASAGPLYVLVVPPDQSALRGGSVAGQAADFLPTKGGGPLTSGHADFLASVGGGPTFAMRADLVPGRGLGPGAGFDVLVDPIPGSSYSDIYDHVFAFAEDALDSYGDINDVDADLIPSSSYGDVFDLPAEFAEDALNSHSEIQDDDIVIAGPGTLSPILDGFVSNPIDITMGPVFDHLGDFIDIRSYSPIANGFSQLSSATLEGFSPPYDHDAEVIFMTILRSLYSQEVTALVPDDLLAPKPPVLTGKVQAAAQDDGVTHGRSLVTLAWTTPTENEDLGGEFIGTADGGAQQFEAAYDAITSEIVREMTGFGGGGRGDTTLAAVADHRDRTITVTDATNFDIGDFVQLDDGANREYFRIQGISGPVLTFFTRVIATFTGFPSGTTTVKEVITASVKTGSGTDYTLNPTTGIIDIVAGQFAGGADIVMEYSTTLQDLDGFTLLRNPTALLADAYEDMILDGSTVVVDDAIASGATSYIDTLTATENGETWFYYLYAKDDETAVNRSEVAILAGGGPVQIDMLPSIPQSLGKTVGDNSVKLSWIALGPGGSDSNVDGYNVWRCDGASLDPPNLFQLNQVLISVGQLAFDDDQAGIIAGDRVLAATVELPINGQSYTYVVEAEDTVTSWDTGTNNQSDGVAAVLSAAKTT